MVPPKTATSRRTIDIDPKVLAVLEEHCPLQKQVRMRYRDTYHDEDFVFDKMDGYPGYPELIKTIENRMRRLLKNAGLNKELLELTPHSLRHTHTSLLAEAGVSLPEVMERLGHKDEDTTKNIYLHVTKEMEKEASQKFARLMENL